MLKMADSSKAVDLKGGQKECFPFRSSPMFTDTHLDLLWFLHRERLLHVAAVVNASRSCCYLKSSGHQTSSVHFRPCTSGSKAVQFAKQSKFRKQLSGLDAVI